MNTYVEGKPPDAGDRWNNQISLFVRNFLPRYAQPEPSRSKRSSAKPSSTLS